MTRRIFRNAYKIHENIAHCKKALQILLLLFVNIYFVLPSQAKDIFKEENGYLLKRKLFQYNQNIIKKGNISVNIDRYNYFPEKVIRIYFDDQAMKANKGKIINLNFLEEYIKDNNITGLSLCVPDCNNLSFVSGLKIDLLAIIRHIDFDFSSLNNANVRRFIYDQNKFSSRSLPDFPNLEDLTLSFISREKFDISLLNKYPNLKKLRLSNVDISGKLKQSIIDNLVLLSIHGQGYEELLQAPNLISLELIRETADLKKIYETNPNLKCIELFYCKMININYLSKFKNLQAITISHADDNVLSEISKTKVNYVCLKRPLKTKNLEKLSGLKRLKILDISYTHISNIAGISKIPIDYLVSLGNYHVLSDKDYAQTRAKNILPNTLWFRTHVNSRRKYLQLRYELLCDYIPNPGLSHII